MANRLEGKVAMITGASRGQGEAAARLFASEGAKVLVCDILDDEGSAVARSICDEGYSAIYQHLDVSSECDWKTALNIAENKYGGLNILINNAGIGLRKPSMLDISMTEWQKVIDINLTGPFLGTKASAPLMRDSGGGSIVNIGSIAGTTGHFATAYTTTKWGIRGLTKSSAMEFASWNIRVNAIHPGIVDTPLVEGSDDFKEAMKWMTPLNRIAGPDEISHVVLFLASDDASFVTGIDMTVDGGFASGGAFRQVFLRAMSQPGSKL